MMSSSPEVEGSVGSVEGTEPDPRQFVTFQVEKEFFAFPMHLVREIIRVPAMVSVPLSPRSLEGIANLRGQVLPIVSLRRSFRFDPRPHDDSTRVIVVESGGLVGFVVDRVASVITVDKDQLEDVTAIDTAVDSDLLASLIKGIGKQPMVMVLDLPNLLRGDFAGVAGRRGGTGQGSATESREAATAATSEERQLVSFVVAGQEYAFPIERVQEIVQVPEHITEVPRAQSHVHGVMTLRSRLLPLVSLRRMFGLPEQPLSSQHRIVVIRLHPVGEGSGAAVVGIVMDAVNEVLRIPVHLVDGLPPFLENHQRVHEVESICRLEDGKRLVSILSVDRLFESEGVREALQRGEDADVKTQEDQAESRVEAEEQFVVFRLAGEEYGVAIDSVQEIIRVPEQMTRVPRSVDCLEGVLNLRGQVLPVVDLRGRFGLEPVARDERQRIVVFHLDDTKTGFIVDSVSEVLKISRSSIGEAPAVSSQQKRLFGRIANLEKQKRMVLLLEAGNLLDAEERSRLDEAVA